MITDSGFHAPWFKNIQRLGWHYIGRVRGIVKVLCESTGQWTTVDELYQQATGSPKGLALVD